MGIDYVLPVNLIRHYKPSVDMNMVPVADVPPQDIEPWQAAMERLWSDRAHWEELAGQSREAALRYARNLDVRPFEQFLLQLLRKPHKAAPVAMTEDKRKLLALRLKQKAAAKPVNPWFAGAEDVQVGKPVLLCLPWAGAGTTTYRQWSDAFADGATVVAVRLPGRESRAAEPPFTDLYSLIDALGPLVLPLARDRKFVVFGHSMGAGVSYELVRWLDRQGAKPSALIVSSARAPQIRTDPPPDTEMTDDQLLITLRKLGGIPANVLDSPALLRLVLPVLRADTRMYRHWIWKPGPPLDVPLVAYAGSRDPNLPVDAVMAWSQQTSATFRGREFAAGHFSFQTQPEEFLSALREDVTSVL
jgi:surfactin synthase thioesterase subunit